VQRQAHSSCGPGKGEEASAQGWVVEEEQHARACKIDEFWGVLKAGQQPWLHGRGGSFLPPRMSPVAS
jgi:hypothetical protein